METREETFDDSLRNDLQATQSCDLGWIEEVEALAADDGRDGHGSSKIDPCRSDGRIVGSRSLIWAEI
jgi:hypothetical protein